LTDQSREWCRVRVRVRGQVQGVGFRPFVHGLAGRLGLSGWVRNDGGGVVLEAAGTPEATRALVRALEQEAPPLARVTGLEVCPLAGPPEPETGFAILDSDPGQPVTTAIAADAGLCEACRAELFDPADRRYRYPFLNCTHCGPRYTLTRRLPCARPAPPNTTIPPTAAFTPNPPVARPAARACPIRSKRSWAGWAGA